MMKKTHHSTGIGVTVLLMVGGMFILLTGMEVYGQEQLQQQQPTSPSPSLSTNQTSQGWMTTFELENCDFVCSGENSYFVLEPGYQVILGSQEDGEELQLVMTLE